MRPWALLLLALPALAEEATTIATPAASTPAASASAPGSREIAGTVATLDLQRHRLSVDTAGGRIELGWDRNTLIYQPGGATSAGALQPGAAVKAGLDPAGAAYWIQVRPAPPPLPPAVLPAAAAPPPASAAAPPPAR